MGRQSDNGVIAKDPATEMHRRVILANMDTIGSNFEGEVGTIVHDEWDAIAMADFTTDCSGSDQRSSIEVLVAQLNDIDASSNARRKEVGEVISGWGAEIKPTITKGDHGSTAEGAAFFFIEAL
jgi:hypothetical protein